MEKIKLENLEKVFILGDIKQERFQQLYKNARSIYLFSNRKLSKYFIRKNIAGKAVVSDLEPMRFVMPHFIVFQIILMILQKN